MGRYDFLLEMCRVFSSTAEILTGLSLFLLLLLFFNTGAQDHQEDGWGGPAHAPHLGQRRGGHDPAGRPERGGAPQEPAGATQGGPHLRRCRPLRRPSFFSSITTLRWKGSVAFLQPRPSL